MIVATYVLVTFHTERDCTIYHDPFILRPCFVPQATVPSFFGDGEVPPYSKLRLKSQPLLEDAQIYSLNVNALRLSRKFVNLIHEGYSQCSFYGDESERTIDNRIEAKDGYFSRLDRRCVPHNSKVRLRLIFELHNGSLVGHRGVASTFAKAHNIFWWKRIRQNVKDFYEHFVVCRRAKIQPQMAASIYPLHVPTIP
jgi:hypothetical protein